MLQLNHYSNHNYCHPTIANRSDSKNTSWNLLKINKSQHSFKSVWTFYFCFVLFCFRCLVPSNILHIRVLHFTSNLTSPINLKHLVSKTTILPSNKLRILFYSFSIYFYSLNSSKYKSSALNTSSFLVFVHLQLVE